MLESSFGLIFVRMYGWRLLEFGAFWQLCFVGSFVHLVRGGGMYARFRRAYVVATEGWRTSNKKQKNEHMN